MPFLKKKKKLLSRFTEPVLTPSNVGKPFPNKRGRKPLSKMPETVSHPFQICFNLHQKFG